MRRLVLLGCAVLLVGCAKREGGEAADTMAAAPAAMLSGADLAGTWAVRAMAENSDSVLVTYELTATGTTDGWTFTFPTRPPIPLRVQIAGDSVMIGGGPYESALRPGVQVTTEGVGRIMDGKLVGTTVAHYSTGADSVLRLRFEGTRKP